MHAEGDGSPVSEVSYTESANRETTVREQAGLKKVSIYCNSEVHLAIRACSSHLLKCSCSCCEGVLLLETSFAFNKYHAISQLDLGSDLCHSICQEQNQCPACLFRAAIIKSLIVCLSSSQLELSGLAVRKVILF